MPGSEKLIFVSSSMDLGEERMVIMDVIRDLASDARTPDVFEPVLWERAREDGMLALQAGSPFQSQITPLLERSAVVIVLFGERLGLPLRDRDALPTGLELEAPIVLATSPPQPGQVPLTGTVCELLYARQLQRQRQAQGLVPEPAVLAFLKAPPDALREDDPATANYGYGAHLERLLEDARHRTGKERLPRLPTDAARDYDVQLRWLHDFARWQFQQSPVTYFETPAELRRLVRSQLQLHLGFGAVRTGNPFKGLASYGIADADDFKGRKEEVAGILAAIDARRRENALPLVLVSGRSGSGKSSLIQAGLAAALKRGQRGSLGRFVPVIANPAQLVAAGQTPLEVLAARIEAEWSSVFSADMPRSCWRGMAPADRVERLAALIAARATETGTRPFLALDQAEEMSRDWRAGDTDSPWHELISFLSEHSARGAGLGLVVFNDAHRSGLLERLAQLGNGERMLDIHVSPPSDTQLNQIITAPFEERGLRLDVELVDKIKRQIREVSGGDESPLPLLSLTLYGLYAAWERSAVGAQTRACGLDAQATDAAGRALRLEHPMYAVHVDLERVVQSVAEQALRSLEASRRIGWRLDDLFSELFRTLVYMGEAGESLRDANYPDDPALREMVDKLLQHRLLRYTARGRIRIAHEAVLRRWPRAQQWLDEERGGLHLLKQLDPRASVWKESGDTGFLLDRGTTERALMYDAAEELFGRWGRRLDPIVRSFVETSLLRSFSKTIERRDDEDAAPRLYWAAMGSSLPLVRHYLDQGADPRLCGRSGRRFPLYGACWQSDPTLVALLLDRGADPNQATSEKSTPLMLASWRGAADIVTLLIERGARTDATDIDGDTALTLAASVGHEDTVAQLLAREADVTARRNDGTTALMRAASGGHDAVVQRLLKRDRDPDARLEPGRETALMFAVQNAAASTVELLALAGADVNAQSSTRMTPLMIAAQCGRSENVVALRRHGARIDEQDGNGWTALMHAVDGGHLPTIAALLKERASATPRIRDGRSVMHLAATSGTPDVLDTLLSLADPHELLESSRPASDTDDSVLELLEMAGRGTLAERIVASFPPEFRRGVATGSMAPNVAILPASWPTLERLASWAWADGPDIGAAERELTAFHSARALRDPARIGRVVETRRARLSCFDGIEIVECLLAAPGGDPARILATLNTVPDGRCLAVAGGRSQVWYEMMRRRLIVAGDPQAAADLLRAFCHYVVGDEGAFTLIEDAAQMPWLPGADPGRQQEVASLIRPLSVSEEGDRFVAKGRVLYGTALFATTLSLQGDQITMLDDEPLVDSLPVAADRWSSRFRVVAGHVDLTGAHA